jgi:hypothetical protein
MRSFTLLEASAFVATLSGTLCGCAGFSEYHNCGYGGCDEDAKITANVEARLN